MTAPHPQDVETAREIMPTQCFCYTARMCPPCSIRRGIELALGRVREEAARVAERRVKGRRSRENDLLLAIAAEIRAGGKP